MTMQHPKYQQTSKSMTSPEQNYFAHFAMSYPVGQNNFGNKIPWWDHELAINIFAAIFL